MTFYVCHLDLLFNVIDARTRRICLLAMPSLRSLRAQSRNLIRFLLSPRVTIQCHLDRSGEVSIRLYILLRFLHFASLQSKWRLAWLSKIYQRFPALENLRQFHASIIYQWLWDFKVKELLFSNFSNFKIFFTNFRQLSHCLSILNTNKYLRLWLFLLSFRAQSRNLILIKNIMYSNSLKNIENLPYRIFYMCGFAIFHYDIMECIGRKFSRYCCRFPGCVPALRLCRRLPGRRRRAWRLVSGSACASLTCLSASFLLPIYPRIVGLMYRVWRDLRPAVLPHGKSSPTVLQRLYAFAVLAFRQSDFFYCRDFSISLCFSRKEQSDGIASKQVRGRSERQWHFIYLSPRA